MQAHEACAGDNVAARTEAVTTVCCDEATEDCSSGYPASCNEGCAEILLPFISDCRPVLGDTAVAFKPVVKLCQQAEEERQQSALCHGARLTPMLAQCCPAEGAGEHHRRRSLQLVEGTAGCARLPSICSTVCARGLRAVTATRVSSVPTSRHPA